MSLHELEQALAAAKWKGAEKDATEILSKMFDVPPELVQRIVFAWAYVDANRVMMAGDRALRDDVLGDLGNGPDLPEEVRKAIEFNVARALRRAALRWRMENNEPVLVPYKKLVDKNDLMKMCDGCPHRLACVRDNLSNPKACLEGHRVYITADAQTYFHHVATPVTVIRLDSTTVTVTAEHPRGTYTLSIMDLNL